MQELITKIMHATMHANGHSRPGTTAARPNRPCQGHSPTQEVRERESGVRRGQGCGGGSVDRTKFPIG